MGVSQAVWVARMISENATAGAGPPPERKLRDFSEGLLFSQQLEERAGAAGGVRVDYIDNHFSVAPRSSASRN